MFYFAQSSHYHIYYDLFVMLKDVLMGIQKSALLGMAMAVLRYKALQMFGVFKVGRNSYFLYLPGFLLLF